MKYATFTRAWWKENPAYPNGLEPCAGTKHYCDEYDTEEEAIAACKEYRKNNDPGRYSLKMEYEEA